MGDWIGLAFFVVLLLAGFFGLRGLAKPRTRTTEEFERGVAEGTTMLGATMNALQEAVDPGAARAKIVVEEMSQGRYQKKKREGKAGGTDEAGIEDETGDGDD